MIIFVEWNWEVHFARRIVHVTIARAIRIIWHSILVVAVSVAIRWWRRRVKTVAHPVLVFRVHVFGIEVRGRSIRASRMRKELVSVVIVHGIVLATVRPTILRMVSAVFGVVRWRKASTAPVGVHDWPRRHATITISHF